MTRKQQDLGASPADAADRVTAAPHEAGKPSSPSGSVPAGAKLSDFTAPLPDAPGLVEVLDLNGFLGALKEHLDPVFAEQRAVWDREGAAAMARAESLGITIDTIGGNCPVQAEGSFDGHQFYFRARHDEWQFHVGPKDKRFTADEWVIERGYGSGFDAGWMHKHEAIGFICDGVEEYRAALAKALPSEMGEG